MELTAVSALHYSCADLTHILEHCFQDYFVPIALTPETFALRFGAEGMSMEDSRVWQHDGEPVAIAIIARRPDATRLAAFAISPAYRGKGLAKSMLAPLFATLKASGIHRLYLEVIGANTAAIKLYQSLGFAIAQGLTGFKAESPEPTPKADLQPATTDALLRAVFNAPPLNLPWLLDPLMLTRLPCEILTDNTGAWAAITTQTLTPQLRLVFVEPASRGQGHARSLLQTINARYPGISTPTALPTQFASLFIGAGFQPLPMTQHEMIWDASAPLYPRAGS